MSLIGEQLGRYRLLRLLGSGGMGEVYLAEDVRIAQQVAIKIIRTEGIAYLQNESAKEATRLFEREARAIARLDHPNILPLYAFGEETLHNMPLSYLVMPYRKEGTLANWLQQRGNNGLLTPAEVAPLVQQAAGALQHAHDHQVIHQDVKPTNFLVRLRMDQLDRPDLLLADFGIAKLLSVTASTSHSIRGTPKYMAPEQWEGHPVPATDQYALAIMVYELLVGHPPFQGGLGFVMRQHYLTSPPAPSTISPHLSLAVDAVLLRALSKEPKERFPSVVTFARAFEEAVRRTGELQATLSISQSEAEVGTTRQLTLLGGRQVIVQIPAGLGHGSTLRLEGQGTDFYEGGPAGPLVLTIVISNGENPLLLQQDSAAPTTIMSVLNQEIPSIEDTDTPTTRVNTPPAYSAITPSLSIEMASSSVSLASSPHSITTMQSAKRGVYRRFVLLGIIIMFLVSGITVITLHPGSTTLSPNLSFNSPERLTALASVVSGINQFPTVNLTSQKAITIDIIDSPSRAKCTPACYAIVDPKNPEQEIISPNVKLKVGTKITWINKSKTIHTVTSSVGENLSNPIPANIFDSGLSSGIATNGTFSYTVTQAAYIFNSNHVVAYYCQYHPSMVAAITVTL